MISSWPRKRVKEFHRDYARGMVRKGVTFLPANDEMDELPSFFTRLIPDMPTTFAVGPDDGAIIARAADGPLLGAVLVAASQFPSGITSVIRAVAVDPTQQGHGIGTVLLGIIPQLVEGTSAIIGNCAEREAKFYSRAGYDVYPAGAAIPFPNAGGRLWSPGDSNSTAHPHALVRYIN